MTDIAIPPEVVEAAAREMCRLAYAHIPTLDWEKQLDDPYWREQARAALTAGLAAWPGIYITEPSGGEIPNAKPFIILPLPPQDAQP